MFSPHTITRMTEQLRQLQDEEAAAVQLVAEKKAAVAEWSELLAYAEQHVTSAPGLAPAPGLGERWSSMLVAPSPSPSATSVFPPGAHPYGGPESGRAPFEPYVPSADREQA
ncbi:hypothetical protein ABT340_04855 [Streptosporangium sp. NPDC000239]|uniref:hypothetical protein n=1 Tax=Streptosporangium sp. NPDC000239 TaxID=3154248 RepID=UPI00332D0631